MSFIITLLYFVIIIGIIIFIHELGHFIFAKRAGIHIYEFALGMGPRIFVYKRKNDETIYSLRAFPIGGFVSMAGEEVQDDDSVPVEKRLYSQSWWNRFVTISAGAVFNFILAWIILLFIGLVNGAPTNKPIISDLKEGYEIYETDIQAGDVITHIDGVRVGSLDRFTLEIYMRNGNEITLEYLSGDEPGEITISPNEETIDGETAYVYGLFLESEFEKGIIPAIQFSFTKFYNLIEQMFLVVGNLVTGGMSMDSLSGPVGIFSVVGDSASTGIISVLFLLALISINIGFINLLPLPALDGGRLWFLIVEKIKGSPVNPKVENTVHTIGLVLLLSLMVYITLKDILNLF